MAGEHKARRNFINSIKKDLPQIIEASGCGELGAKLLEKVKSLKEEILLIIIYIPEKLINKKIKIRVWDTPFPGKQKSLNKTILMINSKILSGEFMEAWISKENITRLSIQNENINVEVLS